MYRDNTKVIKIGNKVIGGGNNILIQSMTNTKTEDVEATVNQIKELTVAGCDIIRCAVPTMEAAKAISEIKKELGLDTPVIQQPIPIKRDGKHLYQVVGYTYPLRPETIDRLNIPPQKILFEVDREQWHREMNEAKENQDKTPKEYIDPWDK